LIVPRQPNSLEDLDLVFDARPDLFINRRIILATNMSEVMRQALIGYDQNFTRSELWLQQGIRDFVEGYDDDALEDLAQAGQLTPENATIDIWIAGIKRAQREPLPPKK
jgi:hypothetical protein